MDPLLRRLGQRIRVLRTERGWSQEEFAEICGVHRTYMGHIERGEKNISFSSIRRVAEALTVPVSELFRGIEDGEIGTTGIIAGIAQARNPAGKIALDRVRLAKEVAAMQRVLCRLKEIAESVGDSKDARATPRKPSRAPKKQPKLV